MPDAMTSDNTKANTTAFAGIESGFILLTFNNSVGRYEQLLSKDIKLNRIGATVITEKGTTFLIPWHQVISVGFCSSDLEDGDRIPVLYKVVDLLACDC